MEKFIKLPAVVKHFKTDENFCLPNIGYNDFHTVRPAHSFYMQKNYTWHFVLSGKGVLEIGDTCYHPIEGDMFFIPPNTQMRYYPTADDPWEYVWFTLKGDLAAHYGELLGFSLQKAVKKCRNFPSVKRILHDVFDDECGYFGVLSAFYRIIEILSAKEPIKEIQGIKKMIDGSFTLSSFSIDQLCRDAGISHAQLLRRFKKEYGVTMIAYLVERRIELACELLETTDLPVCSIAFSCGFTDEVHFMKTFKQKTGLSSTAYRKLHQDKNGSSG